MANTILHIGFTGTRKGMSSSQKNHLPFHIGGIIASGDFDEVWFHHGDCIGADEQAHKIVQMIGFINIHVHPAMNAHYRAFQEGNAIEEPLPYLERNHVIVDLSAVMIACPAQDKEVMRGSGTWATIRYARKYPKKSLMIIPPE